MVQEQYGTRGPERNGAAGAAGKAQGVDEQVTEGRKHLGAVAGSSLRLVRLVGVVADPVSIVLDDPAGAGPAGSCAPASRGGNELMTKTRPRLGNWGSTVRRARGK